MKQQLTGVYTAKRKDGSTYFRASLTYRNKHISLGSYDHEKKRMRHIFALFNC